jgi:reverse gyrase
LPITVVYRGGCHLDVSYEDEELYVSDYCKENSITDENNLELKALQIINKEVENFIEFFTSVTGFIPWSLQRYWIKRLISGESFAMIAPTGVGKSTLLAVYALYRAYFYRSKIYIITPTRELAKQMFSRISEYISRVNLGNVKILLYDSSSKNVDQVKENIRNGDFDILITSAAFLSRHKDVLVGKRIDVVIADDLDSIMKNSKNVDRILALLGFDNNDIELATKIVKLRQYALLTKASKSYEAYEKVRRELTELEAVLRNNIAKKNVQLVVASATGRAKGLKSQVLKLLLGFDAGAIFEYWRNIVDLYHPINGTLLDTLVHIVKKLGSGLIFVSSLYRDLVQQVAARLREEGIKVEVVKSGSKAVDKFRRGEVDVLVGSASYYGILVRGLDEPIRTRYTVFIGVPSIVKDLRDSLNNPRFLFLVLHKLKQLGLQVDDLLSNVIKVITSSTPSMLYMYSKLMKQLPKDSSVPINDDVRYKVELLIDVAAKVYKMCKDVLEKLSIIEIDKNCIIVKRHNKYLVIRPDPFTYIQASGRCSRLLKGRKTFGVAIIFDEYPQLVKLLETFLRRYINTFTVIDFDLSKLSELAKEVEASRSASALGNNISISTALIIVESPTKARTIASMFGKPAKRILGNAVVYETLIPISTERVIVASVMSSLGHITDLVTDEGVYGVKVNKHHFKPTYDFISRCRNCGAQHVGVYDTCPYCGSTDVMSSSSIFNVMKVLALQVDEIYIATDPDTEGEKIAFDIYNLLQLYNRRIYRIEFREVTKNAILNALKNPRVVDLKMVKAQIVRRIIDRWIGFELSLWLQKRFDKPWLGAGRVQSPVLLWVASRYKEYRELFGYVVVVDIGGYRLRLYVGRDGEAKEKAFKLANLVKENGLELLHLEFVERNLPPLPPFTTDTLLQEANTLFGFTASKTMSLAQTLFELGLITYHRTDTTRLSTLALNIAHEAMKKLGLDAMYTPRTWGGDGKEGAHEAIRPTNPVTAEDLVEMVIRGDVGMLTRISEDHVKLYDLIFRRFIASQMPNARIKYIVGEVRVKDMKMRFELPVEILEPGFTLVYPIKLYNNVVKNIDSNAMRIKVENVNVIKSSSINLYRVADIIKMMKEKGIGRPSTYAKAIDNNIRHGYILLSKRKNVLIPTKLGLDVAEIIKTKFLKLVGEDTTKELELLTDRIEEGRARADLVLQNVYESIDSYMRYMESDEVLPQHIFNNMNSNVASITA